MVKNAIRLPKGNFDRRQGIKNARNLLKKEILMDCVGEKKYNKIAKKGIFN